MTHVLLVLMGLLGQVEGGAPAADAPTAAPVEPAPPTDARDVDPRDVDNGDATPAREGAEDQDATGNEGSPAPAVQEGPGLLLTGVASALAGSGGILAAMVLWGLLTPLVYVASFIPGASLLVFPAYLLLLGAGGGSAAWLVSGLLGKRRVPVLPLVGAGALGMLSAVGLGVVGALLLSSPAWLAAAAGYAAFGVGFVSGEWTVMLVGWAAFAAMAVAGAVILGLTYTLVLGTGCLGTGGVLGLLATRLGRQRVAGESGLLFDPISVPSPGDSVDDGGDGDDVDEDDAARPRRKALRGKKGAQRVGREED